MDRMTEVIDWLDGLTWEDWSDYHSDSEVRNIAKAALELLNEYKELLEVVQMKKFDADPLGE